MKVFSIFGPPGTGKTRRLVELADRATQAPDVKNPVYLSYTRAAAAEAVSRLTQGHAVRASTIHSMAFNALGMNRAGVVDFRKMQEFSRQTGIPFKGMEDGSDEVQEGDEYMTVLQYANNRMINIDEAYDLQHRPGTWPRFSMFIDAYADWKKAFGYMDFDDMLYHFIAMPSVNMKRHGVVFLDEAQDCSPLQWKAFNLVCAHAEHVFIAGDDDQAIYEWNGANPHGMIEFTEEHDGKITVLDQSHRVPRSALGLAAAKCLDEISKRVPKEFKARDAQGTITEYGDFINIDVTEFDNEGGGMVLVRDRFKLDEVKKEFNRSMIPYRVLGGHSPWVSKVAEELRKGNKPEIPAIWREFYRQADLNRPVLCTLSTIHQAKGRENKRVLLDLTLPTRALLDLQTNRDAELRVMYVALTRVSEDLILCGSNPLI